MGNTKSSNKLVNKIENTLSKTELNEIRSSCVQTSSASNQINISGSTVTNLDVEMTNEIKNNCFLTQTLKKLTSTDMNSSLSQDIIEHQMDSSMLGGNKSTKAVYNTLKENVDINEIAKSYSDCLQKVDFKNVLSISDSTVSDSTIALKNQQFNECLMNSFINLGSKYNISDKIDSSIETTQKKEDISWFKSIWIWILVIIIIIGVLIYKFGCKIPGPWMVFCKIVGNKKNTEVERRV